MNTSMGEVMEEITITLKGRGAAKVAAFALGMQEKLNENGHKPGWKKESPFCLLERLQEETDELEEALLSLFDNVFDLGAQGSNRHARIRGELRRESFDVGNFAMMIADVVGGLE